MSQTRKTEGDVGRPTKEWAMEETGPRVRVLLCQKRRRVSAPAVSKRSCYGLPSEAGPCPLTRPSRRLALAKVLLMIAVNRNI